MAGELGADLADAVAQGDHPVEALAGELVQVLRAPPGDVDPRARASRAPRWDAAAWGGCRRCAPRSRRRPRCSASASAICERALLPVQRNSTRVRRRRLAARPTGARHEPQAGMQRATRPPPAARRSGRGRARSRCRGRRPSCAGAETRRCRRAAGRGGRRRGSAAARRARSARRPAGRCAPAHRAAASEQGGQQASETSAARAHVAIARRTPALDNTSI